MVDRTAASLAAGRAFLSAAWRAAKKAGEMGFRSAVWRVALWAASTEKHLARQRAVWWDAVSVAPSVVQLAVLMAAKTAA